MVVLVMKPNHVPILVNGFDSREDAHSLFQGLGFSNFKTQHHGFVMTYRINNVIAFLLDQELADTYSRLTTQQMSKQQFTEQFRA